jgi:excisionase family DNA binding protein
MENYMGVKELATLLDVNPETIRRMTRAKKIPALQIGATFRYRFSEVKASLEAGQEKAR